ncbi:hypothetical protein G7Y89_g955 [Cudoniella acicularis]|uniref:Prenyltransferase alpha-alpha toroid domain-containing protein n=1 Tax=Cudoniella acicularis TaxID=354080 RepID=A0A8H4RZ13_9HELO|nr:hypothetical protein G7Y89_g955 [Cudoniella acicularis]
MADQVLRDRQDAPIWNAIEAENFKQALKLVDKRLAKKPSEYHEALKIFIRSHSPLVSEKAAIILHLEELVERKLVIPELETIELYDEAFENVLPEPQESWERIVGELRWLCVKSQPKNEDLSLKCFEACLAKDDLEHAKQTSAKYPEKQRKLWSALALAQIGKLSAATKQADPKQLPIRSIHTPQELLLLQRITEMGGKIEQRLDYLRDPSLGPESAIAKGEWQLWRFRLKLLERAQAWQELFDTTKVLLKRARTKDESGQLSESGLSDWIVWEAFIRSAVELQGHEFKDEVTCEVEAHLDPTCEVEKSWKRNASLAWVKVSLDASSAFASTHDTTQHRVTIIVKYLQQYGVASTAYSDLRPFIEQLNTDERKQLLDALSSNAVFGDPGHSSYVLVKPGEIPKPEYNGFKTGSKITEHINAFKLRYLLLSGLPENEKHQNPIKGQQYKCISCSEPCNQFCTTCLRDLANGATKLYLCAIDGGRHSWNLQATDRHPADDLCILAAMCLVKLSEANGQESFETSYILQASALLDYGLSHSTSNFQIRLLLTRLCQFLGCGVLAMSQYQELSLKQIQLDTLSYTLFDRISTFHPHSFTPLSEDSQPYRTPLESLKKQQKLYRGARGHVRKNIWLSFKHGSYNTIFELMEALDTLSRTISAVMSSIEARKVSRLVEPNTTAQEIVVDGGYDIIPHNLEMLETPFSDSNDYESFPNFESTKGPRFEEISRVFPGPSDYRVRVNLATEKLIQLIDTAASPESSKTSIQAALSSFLTSASTPPKSPTPSHKLLSKPENLARIASESMTLIILDACNHDRWSEPKFQSRVDTYNKDLLASLEGQAELLEDIKELVPALAITLHALYTAYDIAKTAVNFCTFLSKQGKEVHQSQAEASKKMEEVAKKVMKVVADKTLLIKKGLDEGGWIDKVLDSVLGGEEEESVLDKSHELAWIPYKKRKSRSFSQNSHVTASQKTKFLGTDHGPFGSLIQIGVSFFRERRSGVGVPRYRLSDQHETEDSSDPKRATWRATMAEPEPHLDIPQHIKYWQRCLNSLLPTQYTSTDSSRMTLGFFILSALDLLGAGAETFPAQQRAEIRNWILKCQHPHGGFCGSPNHRYPDDFYTGGEDGEEMDPANLPATYFAILSLSFVGGLEGVKREECLKWLKRLQRPDGSFGELVTKDGKIKGGYDMRYCYVLTSVRWMLRGDVELSEQEKEEDINVEALVNHLRSGQTYDGGISESFSHEAHGKLTGPFERYLFLIFKAGYTYCALASLSILNRLPNSQPGGPLPGIMNIDAAIRWLVSRQVGYQEEEDEEEEEEEEGGGELPMKEQRDALAGVYKDSPFVPGLSLEKDEFVGFNGRCNKNVDTCYTFWVGAALDMLGENNTKLVDLDAIRRFLFQQTQHRIGGFGKYPGSPPDIYHSYLGLAALAVLKEPGIKPLDSAICISKQQRERISTLRATALVPTRTYWNNGFCYSIREDHPDFEKKMTLSEERPKSLTSALRTPYQAGLAI